MIKKYNIYAETDNGIFEFTIFTNNKEDAYFEAEQELANCGVYVADAIIDVT